MSTSPVVTLFETYAAGAREIGPKVAERLGVTWVDQAFSSEDLEAGRHPGRSEGSALGRFLRGFAAGAASDDPSLPAAQASDHDRVMENTRQVLASAESGMVMLGHNAAAILADRPASLHVFIDAPVAERVAHAVQREGLDEKTAARRQKHEDHVRAHMSRTLYQWDVLDHNGYDLVVNAGRLDPDAAADVIVAAWRAKAPA